MSRAATIGWWQSARYRSTPSNETNDMLNFADIIMH
jgi:hypothetical protein